MKGTFLQEKCGESTTTSPFNVKTGKKVHKFWEQYKNHFDGHVPKLSDIARQATRIIVVMDNQNQVIATAIIHKCVTLGQKVKMLFTSNIISHYTPAANQMMFDAIFIEIIRLFSQQGKERRKAVIVDDLGSSTNTHYARMYATHGFIPQSNFYVRP